LGEKQEIKASKACCLAFSQLHPVSPAVLNPCLLNNKLKYSVLICSFNVNIDDWFMIYLVKVMVASLIMGFG
jgi:hypothetical protein